MGPWVTIAASRTVGRFEAWRPLQHIYIHLHNYNTQPEEPMSSDAGTRGDELVNTTIRSIVRVDLVSAEAALAFFKGLGHMNPNRVDIRNMVEREESFAKETRKQLPKEGARPSLLGPITQTGFGLTGFATSLLPSRIRDSVISGMNEAMEEIYIEQLRMIREAGIADKKEELRSLIRRLRDHDRVPEGAPKVPDITTLRDLSSFSEDQGLSFIVKQGTKAILGLAEKI